MSRRWVVPLLVVGALLVALENLLFFTGGDEEWDGAEDELALLDEVLDGVPAAQAEVAPPRALSEAELWSLVQRMDHARSPFLPVSATRAARPRGLRLDGTLVGEGRRIAWIDGRPRQVGDHHADYRVVAISPGRVVIDRHGERRVLTAQPETRSKEHEENPE